MTTNETPAPVLPWHTKAAKNLHKASIDQELGYICNLNVKAIASIIASLDPAHMVRAGIKELLANTPPVTPEMTERLKLAAEKADAEAVDPAYSNLRDIALESQAVPAPGLRQAHDDPSDMKTCNEVLERECDQLREKVENQRQRIVYLEGATHHACGTPLTLAREEIAQLRYKLASTQRDLGRRTDEPNGAKDDAALTRTIECAVKLATDQLLDEVDEERILRVGLQEARETNLATIRGLETEVERLKMENDSMCNAEELRQARAAVETYRTLADTRDCELEGLRLAVASWEAKFDKVTQTCRELMVENDKLNARAETARQILTDLRWHCIDQNTKDRINDFLLAKQQTH